MSAPARAPVHASARPHWLAKLLIVHFCAYPIALVAAVAAVPVLVPMYEDELTLLPDETAMAAFLTHKLLWPGGLALLLAHVAVVPWLVHRDERAGRRLALLCMGGLAGLAVVSAVLGWGWLLTRQ